MSLPRLFAQLYGEAATTGRPVAKNLKGGAALKVRVEGLRRQVIIGRAGAPVGETEEQTFRRDGRIPAEAERAEYTVKDYWHYVVFTWEEPPGLFDDEPATP